MKCTQEAKRGKAIVLAACLTFLLTIVLTAGILATDGHGPAAAREKDSPAQQTMDVKAQALRLLDRGELAAASGHFDQAARWWHKALQLRPGWAMAKARLADLAQRRQRFAPDKAERKQRSRARIQFVEGVSSFNAGEYQRAIELFATCLRVFPDDARTAKYLKLARDTAAGMRVGSLQVNCQPKAEVYLDGELKGVTPLVLEAIPAGSYRVRVKSQGDEAATEVVIRARALSGVEFSLLGGGLEVVCTPQASVFLDGRYLGRTPLKLPWLPVVGSHVLRVSREGYGLWERSIVLEKGKITQLDLRLYPK